jgi:hypothetical protein
MSEYGMMLMAALLAFMGALTLRRRGCASERFPQSLQLKSWEETGRRHRAGPRCTQGGAKNDNKKMAGRLAAPAFRFPVARAGA